MTLDELNNWVIYYQSEGFGEIRNEIRNAISIGNLLQPHVKKDQKLKLSSFMFKGFKPKYEQTQEQIANVFKAFAALNGAEMPKKEVK